MNLRLFDGQCRRPESGQWPSLANIGCLASIQSPAAHAGDGTSPANMGCPSTENDVCSVPQDQLILMPVAPIQRQRLEAYTQHAAGDAANNARERATSDSAGSPPAPEAPGLMRLRVSLASIVPANQPRPGPEGDDRGKSLGGEAKEKPGRPWQSWPRRSRIAEGGVPETKTGRTCELVRRPIEACAQAQAGCLACHGIVTPAAPAVIVQLGVGVALGTPGRYLQHSTQRVVSLHFAHRRSPAGASLDRAFIGASFLAISEPCLDQPVQR